MGEMVNVPNLAIVESAEAKEYLDAGSNEE